MDKDIKTKSTDEKAAPQMEYPIIGKSRAVEQLIKQIHRLSKLRRDVVLKIGRAHV